MLRALANRLTAAIGRPVARARRALTETLRPSGVAAGFVADMFRTRDELLADVHFAVTREPSEAWTAQQLRQLTPFGERSRVHHPWSPRKVWERVRSRRQGRRHPCSQDRRSCAVNSTCERFLGSVRHECLDHIIIFGQRHLQSVLGEYVAYFNTSRPHQGIQQTVPAPASEEILAQSAQVVAFPVLNGLHHDYRRAA